MIILEKANAFSIDMENDSLNYCSCAFNKLYTTLKQ